MELPARLRPALAIGFAAGIYLLTLTVSTRFGLGLGMDQFAGAAAVVRTGVSYAADVPAELVPAAGTQAADDPWRALHHVPFALPAATLAMVAHPALDPSGHGLPQAQTPPGLIPTSTAAKKIRSGHHPKGDEESDGKHGQRGAHDH